MRYTALVLLIMLPLAAPASHAQRHSERSSPPTAQFVAPAPVVPVAPVSTGMGAIQFAPANYGVPAPQALTRQLRFDDDRTRAAALSSIGAPAQYLQHGHIPMPRSINLELAPISGTDEIDALLTVELDQHLVTAVLIPVDGNWRRIATLTYAVPFENAISSPTAWVRTSRSLIDKNRYRAVFHASTASTDGDFTENEAHLRIINGKAVITISFESTNRECDTTTIATRSATGPTKAASRAANGLNNSGKSVTRSTCTIARRWLQADPADPTKQFQLVTATGTLNSKDIEEPLADARVVLESHLRNFSCQPFIYSDTNQRYEATAANGPCRNK